MTDTQWQWLVDRGYESTRIEFTDCVYQFEMYRTTGLKYGSVGLRSYPADTDDGINQVFSHQTQLNWIEQELLRILWQKWYETHTKIQKQ
jgi:hypothetical protein